MMRHSLLLFAACTLSGSLLFGQGGQEHDQHKPANEKPKVSKPATSKRAPSRQAAAPHGEGTHTHAAAAKIRNPVTPDAVSIAAGEKLYAIHCATCHGPKGAGDGVQASRFTPRPSNLIDAPWKHGPSDGEIFTVIRNGVPKTAMSAFSKKLTERQTWDVVNFMRSAGPKTEPAHAH